MQIAAGHPEPRIQLFPRMCQVIRGVELTRSVRGNQMRTRLPITPSILRKLRGSWWSQGSQSSALTASFGFCQLGELAVPREGDYDPSVHLSLTDVACNNQQHSTAVSLLLHRMKMDQARRKVKIVLRVTRTDLCAVQALLEYLSLRGREPGPLFLWSDRKPVTKTRLVEEVRLALRGAGLPEKKFAGHSFRIGAATTASAAGVEDSTIKALGRWKSSAFLSYPGKPQAASGCLTHYCTHRQNLLWVRGVGYSGMSIFHHVILYVIVIVSVHVNQDLVGRLRNGNTKVGRLPLMVQTVLQSIVPPHQEYGWRSWAWVPTHGITIAI